MQYPSWSTLQAHLVLRDRVRFLEPRLSFVARWADRPREWRVQMRRRLGLVLGLTRDEQTPEYSDAGLPRECPLDPQEVDRTEGEGFTSVRIHLTLEQQMGAWAWLCVPHDNEQPLPAVVCIPDASGKDPLVGLTGSGPALATELARRGYVTLAPDLRGTGERADSRPSLDAAGTLLGTPLAGMDVWDICRCVEYLSQRPDVLSARVGVLAHGPGWFPALLAAAWDERIACTTLCGAMGTYREWLVHSDLALVGVAGMPLLPGLLQWADLDDVACLVAPRPLMMRACLEGSTLPRRGAEELLGRVARGYEVMGEKVKFEAAEGGPAAGSSAELLRFLDDWLKLPLA
jgi:hypothetical protein